MTLLDCVVAQSCWGGLVPLAVRAVHHSPGSSIMFHTHTDCIASHLSGFETLERRLFFSSDVRSFDGTANNLAYPDFGAAGTELVRLTPPAFSDGSFPPAGVGPPPPPP